jgi:uncharacterized protein (DUF433 family)
MVGRIAEEQAASSSPIAVAQEQQNRRAGSMQLEDYFDFWAPDDIRVKGTRVGVETILYEHIHRRQTPEALAQKYPSVTLEQVYATVLYYLHNKEAMSAYVADWLEWGRRQRQAQEGHPPPFVAHLRQMKTMCRAS